MNPRLPSRMFQNSPELDSGYVYVANQISPPRICHCEPKAWQSCYEYGICYTISILDEDIPDPHRCIRPMILPYLLAVKPQPWMGRPGRDSKPARYAVTEWPRAREDSICCRRHWTRQPLSIWEVKATRLWWCIQLFHRVEEGIKVSCGFLIGGKECLHPLLSWKWRNGS